MNIAWVDRAEHFSKSLKFLNIQNFKHPTFDHKMKIDINTSLLRPL